MRTIKNNLFSSNLFNNQKFCAVIECDELPTTYENANIVATNGSFYGARAEIICPPGYKNNGPKFITCLATGQWSSPLSACIRGNYHKNIISFEWN